VFFVLTPRSLGFVIYLTRLSSIQEESNENLRRTPHGSAITYPTYFNPPRKQHSVKRSVRVVYLVCFVSASPASRFTEKLNARNSEVLSCVLGSRLLRQTNSILIDSSNVDELPVLLQAASPGTNFQLNVASLTITQTLHFTSTDVTFGGLSAQDRPILQCNASLASEAGILVE